MKKNLKLKSNKEQNIVVKLNSVNKFFNVGNEKVHVLKDINLEIKAGDFVIIFGPSGSGKSTLLHTILGLEVPSNGEVQLFGQDLSQISQDSLAILRKRKVGFISQQANWINGFNLEENIAFPSILDGYPESISNIHARELLNQLDLEERLKFSPVELSSGQQQKASLARSLVTNPDLVVADEPTGNMDYESGINLIKYLQNLNNQGKTIIMVTHDYALLAYAKNIIQFFDGRIVNTIDARDSGIDLMKLALDNDKSKFKTYKPDHSENTILEPIQLERKNKFQFKELLNTFSTNFNESINTLIYSIGITLAFPFRLLFFLLRQNKFLDKYIPKHFFISHQKEKYPTDSIPHGYLIKLSFASLLKRKARTLVTIGGMAISISIVVFLITLSFGLENFVVSRIANSEEIKQFEATPVVGSSVKITDETLNQFEGVSNVTSVEPLISAIGKIDYQGSQTALAIYGTRSGYLSTSSISTNRGRLFSDNSTVDTSKVTSKVVTEESTATNSVRQAEILDGSTKEAVVNSAFLSTFSLDINNALDKTFSVSFLVTADLTADGVRIESNYTNYKIVGVIPGDEEPIAYVNIEEIKSLGVNYYSQFKVNSVGSRFVPELRNKTENLGFKTTSVQDTIDQIGGVFSTLRTVLGTVGGVSLVIASLGIFNTLTVSLLERIRQVGYMKIIGMRSKEISSLFLTEALIISVFGGIAGLILGTILGKLFSLIISLLLVGNNSSPVDISSTPFSFVLGILGLSLITGLLTGLYPAYRSSKISALDALRYE